MFRIYYLVLTAYLVFNTPGICDAIDYCQPTWAEHRESTRNGTEVSGMGVNLRMLLCLLIVAFCDRALDDVVVRQVAWITNSSVKHGNNPQSPQRQEL